MAFSRFQTDTDNISALSDRPNDADGLTAEQLKARFDKAGDDIKDFLNNTLLAELEETTAAVNIGIDPIPGLEVPGPTPGTTVPASNVQEALAALYTFANDAYQRATGNRRSPAFSITGGTYAYKEQAVAGSDQNNWELALLSGTNAKINFARTTGPIDVFLIGGGSPGSTGTLEGYVAKGGSGGRSGKRVTRLNMEIEEGVNYSFSVGGPGNVTKIFGIESRTGTHTDGGDGAKADLTNYPGSITAAEEGGDGEYAFGDANCLLFPGRKYGASGGGGGVSGQRTITHYDPQQGATWTEYIQQNAPGANGGTTGGGYGANTMSHEPGSGADNTGSGGGGAFFYSTDNGNGSGARGTGGSGIIIIRNARG